MTLKSRKKQKKINKSVKSQVYVVTRQSMQTGLLYYFLTGLKVVFTLVWGTLVFPLKKIEKRPIDAVELEENPICLNETDQKTWIYSEWRKNWLSDPNGKSEEEAFFRLFTYDYIYTCNQYKHNKRKNFQMKFLCMLPLIIATVLFFFAVLGYNTFLFIQAGSPQVFMEKMDWSFSIFSTFLYGVVFIICNVIVKWLDVRKYQETWNRHSKHKYKIDMEMFQYISNMGEYAEADKRQKFIKKIMETWNENQEKFNENMKKEKPMNDMLKNTKGE